MTFWSLPPVRFKGTAGGNTPRKTKLKKMKITLIRIWLALAGTAVFGASLAGGILVMDRCAPDMRTAAIVFAFVLGVLGMAFSVAFWLVALALGKEDCRGK